MSNICNDCDSQIKNNEGVNCGDKDCEYTICYKCLDEKWYNRDKGACYGCTAGACVCDDYEELCNECEGLD